MDNKSITITRTLNAPIETVWQAFTEPDHIAKWLGPNGFTNTIHTMDVRPGGEWNLTMHGPDGTDYKNKSVYTDVRKHELLAYDHVSGPRFQASISFRADGDKTHVTWHMEFETAGLMEKVIREFKADEGLKQNVDKLEKHLITMNNTNKLEIHRVFDAPLNLVWQAWTQPEMLMRWWGPKGFTSPVCKMDFRIGGSYHFCMKGPNGAEFWTTGIYKEIEPMKRIVWTDSFADANGNVVHASHYGMADMPLELLVTLIFSEQDGKTHFTLIHEGLPAGDMAAAGWGEMLDKLAAMVA